MKMLAKSNGISIGALACLALLLGGCAQSKLQMPWTAGGGIAPPTTLNSSAAAGDPTATGAVSPVAAMPTAAMPAAPTAQDTPSGRSGHLAWNTAWAQSCGFYFDNQKLKASYLAYEARAGLPADQVDKIAGLFDRAQTGFRTVAASHPDQCTDNRLALIKAAIARYLTGDFSPGQAV